MQSADHRLPSLDIKAASFKLDLAHSFGMFIVLQCCLLTAAKVLEGSRACIYRCNSHSCSRQTAHRSLPDMVLWCRASKDETPHVVIDVHASSPVQRSPAEALLAAQQQGPQQTTGPMPIVLEQQSQSQASHDR